MPEIRFSYQPPTAGEHEVGIAGDFTSWEILDLVDTGGIYIISLHVENGIYRYKLIADGNWIPDPGNPSREPDPFGGYNSILEVKTEKAPEFTWEDVWRDKSLLLERTGHYFSLNRISEDRYELRFRWYTFLPAELTAILDGEEHPLFRLGRKGKDDLWHCRFKTSKSQIGIIIRISTGDRALFYFGEHGFSEDADAFKPRGYELSALQVFAVPDWVHKSVIYQIFPDRFRNSDHALDPDFSEDYYTDCREPPPEGEILPPHREYYHLVRDWNDISGLKQSPWLEEGKPDWWSFYGGDIPGVRQKLDYLRDLGISVIYFNPLWQAKSNHKYDAADFCKIDPHFGTEDDMKALVGEAHQIGIRIIVDVAFNHTGDDFWAFQDCVQKGPDSEYWTWYDWKKWPLPDPLPPDFKPREYYQCWWGIKDMPDLNFDHKRHHPAENYVKDISRAEPNWPLVEHILKCVGWWLKEIGIDGFRLDIPDEVPFWFWQIFREHVKKIKPDAWIVGEIWHNAKSWVSPRCFDSVMNYAYFKDPLLEFFILQMISPEAFRGKIEEGLAEYSHQSASAMMNLLGSHDTIRVLELAEGEISRLKLAVLFQMTFIAAPHIYYGDEIAMRGGRDPDNRRPFNWDWNKDARSRDLRDQYRELIKLRKGQILLTDGEFAFLEAPEGIIAHTRYDETGRINVVLNFSEETQVFRSSRAGETLFNLGKVVFQSGEFRLPSGSGIVFVCQK